MDYSAMDHERAKQFVKGKRVVVGFQKQGLDIAMECSSENGSMHMIIIYLQLHTTYLDEVYYYVSFTTKYATL